MKEPRNNRFPGVGHIWQDAAGWHFETTQGQTNLNPLRDRSAAIQGMQTRWMQENKVKAGLYMHIHNKPRKRVAADMELWDMQRRLLTRAWR